jgi:hypothetical protein
VTSARQGDLSGVHAKIARAHEHIEQFELEELTWCNSDAYRIVREFDYDTSPHVLNICYRIVDVRDVPATVLTVIGDALFNLRSALDHLAHQLVVASGGKPTRWTAFPIYSSPFNEKGKLRKFGIAGGVTPIALADVERLQPYAPPGFGPEHPLSVLQELNNADKHRQLLVTGLLYSGLTAEWPDGKASVSDLGALIPVHEGKYFTTLGVTVDYYKTHAAEMDVQFKPTVSITLAQGEVAAGHPVGELLRRLESHVKSVVAALSIHVG